ncbi:hypothetical protein POV27_03390 [Aureisphaera galaxeae]|uniref:hypothetical protein n=1 Tax=Aureisphaera galaxeae TaxID=1538023 RepID=UPI002350B1A1|nr:hypothetical protein [Aureisphaera galaxeae]MDC8003078.1 hypothetical protein [Aureisphaera galaxeae]
MEHPIFKKIENSKPADFGDIFSKSFEIYKTHFTEGLVHTLISIGVSIPLLLIVYIPVLPLYIEMMQNAGDPYYTPSFLDEYSLPVILGWYLLVFLMSFLMQAINFSIYGHLFKVLKKKDFNTNEDVGGYFDIIKRHFGKMIVLSLASAGIAILATLACYIPLFYVIVPLHWIFPIFIFNEDLGVSDIIKAAFKFANKNWLMFALLGIVCGILGSIGIIGCYIGIIFTYFFPYMATYVTYRDCIGFDDVDEISSIGQTVEE